MIGVFDVEKVREDAEKGEGSRQRAVGWHGYVSNFKARQSAVPSRRARFTTRNRWYGFAGYCHYQGLRLEMDTKY